MTGPFDRYVRRHRRRALVFGVAWGLSAILLARFSGHSAGAVFLPAALLFWLAFILEAGWAFMGWLDVSDRRRIHWNYLRGTRKIED